MTQKGKSRRLSLSLGFVGGVGVGNWDKGAGVLLEKLGSAMPRPEPCLFPASVPHLIKSPITVMATHDGGAAPSNGTLIRTSGYISQFAERCACRRSTLSCFALIFTDGVVILFGLC